MPARMKQQTGGGAESTNVWVLILTGVNAALGASSLVCRLPYSRGLSWGTVLLRSTVFVALSAAAGAAAVWFLWSALSVRLACDRGYLARRAVASWIFLPCIVLLDREQSPWVLFVVTFATVAAALSLREVFLPLAEPLPTGDKGWQTRDLAALYGLPEKGGLPWRMFAVSLCAQGALILAIGGHLSLSCFLVSTGVLLFMWSLFDANRVTARWASDPRAPISSPSRLTALAILVTALALIPWVNGGYAGTRWEEMLGMATVPSRPAATQAKQESGRTGSNYIGIVLLPPVEKKKLEIIPPIARVDPLRRGEAKPVVIPFDGAYWYFQAPDKGPGPGAHIAHGRSTEVNVRSADRRPLLMAAHQRLSRSIDLDCCSEVDIAITNADHRPGKIGLGAYLTDFDAPGRPTQYLGEVQIASSVMVEGDSDRAPVKETVRLPIPRAGKVRRFDEITVVFLLGQEHALSGAKVAIQSFELKPR